MTYVLITGASTGIGYSTAKLLLQAGYGILGSVRNEADASRLRQDLGPDFHPLVFDVCDPQAISEAAVKAGEIVGENGLKGLINNAGIAVSGPLQHIPPEEFIYQFEVNVFGVLRITQAFLPLLGAARNSPFPPGKIINISSVSGILTLPFLGPYCASKFALESMSDALRRELLIYGIDVIVVQPGPVQTPIWDKAREDKSDYSHTDYGPILSGQKKMINASVKRAIPVISVSKLIHKILLNPKPRTRYLITKNKIGPLIATKLPDRLIDYFIGKELKKAIQ